MNPFLSLIIPVYKVEAYVGACLDSILTALKQVEADESFEVICIDDGSPDRSGEILEPYRERFAALPRAERVSYTVIHQPNGGVSFSRNVGLDRATGEWVWFIDADDSIAPFSLSYLVRALREHPVDVFRFGFQEVVTLSAPFHSIEQAIRFYDLTTDAGVRDASRHRLLDPYIWNVCYRRPVIGGRRFLWNLQVGEDGLFSTQVVVRSSTYAETETVLYNYLQRSDSCLRMMNLKKHEDWPKSEVLRLRTIRSWPNCGDCVFAFRRICDMMCIHYESIAQQSRLSCQALMPFYMKAGLYAFKGYPFYQWLFQTRCRLMVFLFLYLPWRIRVCLRKIKVVRMIKDLVRGNYRKGEF